MGKKLSEMTLEELWQLFPIFLTEHQDRWRFFFEEEAEQLKKILRDKCRIHHVGSTAVDGICAKPIVDILVETECENLTQIAEKLVSNGWILMSSEHDRFHFNKGYTEDGFAEKVFHLHLHKAGDRDEIFFRDYLISHPDVAGEYEKLKLSLAEKFRNNRDAYTEAKSEFVKKYTDLAKLEG